MPCVFGWGWQLSLRCRALLLTHLSLLLDVARFFSNRLDVSRPSRGLFIFFCVSVCVCVCVFPGCVAFLFLFSSHLSSSSHWLPSCFCVSSCSCFVLLYPLLALLTCCSSFLLVSQCFHCHLFSVFVFWSLVPKSGRFQM